MKLTDKYRKSLQRKWCLRFRTTHPEGDHIEGVVCQVRQTFIVLREEYEFELDGVIVLPKKWIKSCRDSKYECCCNDIIRQNSSIKKARVPRWMHKCNTLTEVLSGLMNRDIWPGVETIYERASHKYSAFYVGPLKDVNECGFDVLCYDAAGQWEKVYHLQTSEVFKIVFDDTYTKHFNNYMRSL